MSNSGNALLPMLGTLAGVVIGTVASVGTTYWITYEGVEKPKLELETKKAELELRKAAIEIHKQALALTPNISFNCNSTSVDPWTWKVLCTVKNVGNYPADIAISDAKISLSTDTKEVLYESGRGFKIDYPNNKQSFRATPGVAGDLWFYVSFDQAHYKDGVSRSDLVARVFFSFQTIQSASTYIVGQFPELKDVVTDISKYGYAAWVNLPYVQVSR